MDFQSIRARDRVVESAPKNGLRIRVVVGGLVVLAVAVGLLVWTLAHR